MRKYFFLFVFSSSFGQLFAAALPADTKQELITDVSGGLNTTIPSHKLTTQYTPYSRNVFIDDRKIKGIDGFKTIGSSRTLGKVNGIFPYILENGQTKFIVTDSSISLETSDFKNWMFVSSGSNAGGKLTWMQVRNKMWGFNGVDFPMTWDGTTKVILNGNNGTPSVPKFKCGAYYQDRVWGFSIPNGISDLYFTSTVGTDNIILAPDNFLAWPPINAIFVGRGDGQIGTALWGYQGLLRAGKDQSIYTIYGNNPGNYAAVREEASLGVVSQDSVRVLDGETHFLGQTGVYRNTKRISDSIQPDIETMNKGITDIVLNSWDSQLDFSKGQFFGTTATPSGLLTISTNSFNVNYDTYGPADILVSQGNFFEFSSTQAQFAQYGIRIPTETVPTNFKGYVSKLTLRMRILCPSGSGAACGGHNTNWNVYFRNNRTKEIGRFFQGVGPIGGDSSWAKIVFGDLQVPVLFDADDINNSNLTIQISTQTNMDAGDIMQIFPATYTGTADIFLTASTTGQFISEVSTLAAITAWSNFDSANNTNGGLINYFFHTSTSSVNITTQTWKPISAGTIISEPIINNYIQWASTIQAVNVTNPNIDNVIISHIEGPSADARAFAMDWNNRYWLCVSTNPSNLAQRLIYVKSKITNANPDAWMPIEGIPVDCFAKANNVLYGGSTSTGIIYRLDYGTNFDGAAINYIYDVPDLVLGDYFFDKYVLKYIIDGDKSVGGTMTVGSSVNGGTFSNSTFSISGTGRYSQIVEGIAKPVKTLRLRLQNAEKDIGLGINNVNILYEPKQSLSNQ